MPRKYLCKDSKLWTDSGVRKALEEKLNAGTSFRKLADKYNVPLASLHRHWEAHETKTALKMRGRKSVFSSAEEAELASCITDLAHVGFALTIKDVAELVHSYVEFNDIAKAKQIFKYNGVTGYPGPDWMRLFLKRCNLSLKDATKLCVARRNATNNPFVIMHFYDILEETIEKLGLQDRPEQIWNVDESGMPHEPNKCKVISRRGQKTLQVIPGSDRENTTVLAACSAAGKAFPPMIVHSGKQVQSTWKPDLPEGYEFYPWMYANDSGWMTSELFYKWFEKFEEATRTFKHGTEEVEPRYINL